MITFLNCEAETYLKLRLKLDYQDKDKIRTEYFEINPDAEYKISFANNEYGLVTTVGKIVGYSLCTKGEPKSFVNVKAKPVEVDTIKLDCSEEGSSKVYTINISDIRYIEEYMTNGFNEIVQPIKKFI